MCSTSNLGSKVYELAFHLADGIDAVQLSTLLPCTAMCGVSESPLQGLSRPMRVQVSLTRSAGCNDPSLLEIESLFSRIQCISIVPLSIPWSHADEPNVLQALKRPASTQRVTRRFSTSYNFAFIPGRRKRAVENAEPPRCHGEMATA